MVKRRVVGVTQDSGALLAAFSSERLDVGADVVG
jgi:hypothetical protein